MTRYLYKLRASFFCMMSNVTRGVLDVLFYFAIFFLVMGFVIAHLSFPFKMVGNVMKNPAPYVESGEIKNVYQSLNQWGIITFLDGSLVAVAIVILVFLRFSWKKMCEVR